MENLLRSTPAGDRLVGRAWVALAMLTAAQVLSFMDRFLLNILGQPIKEDLHLADWQLGLLNGLAFAASYTLVGIPLARLAERRNRVSLIVACILLWSGMTMLCGLATSLWQLMLLRTGVGVGEAGALPASHSLITDYFPPRRRATALAVLGVGIPLGALLGSTLGGSLADAAGWRHAFLVLGAPGLMVALLAALLIREIPRGQLDPVDKRVSAADPPPSFRTTTQLLWRSRTARQIVTAMIAVTLVGTVSSTFLAPLLVRKFKLTYTEVGVVLSVAYLMGGIGGNLAGGLLSDWAGRRDKRWYLWIPCIGLIVSIPFYIAAYLQHSVVALTALMILPSIVSMAYLAPSYAVLHNIVQVRMRATMVATVQLTTTLLGAGIGPLVGGYTIDVLASRWFSPLGLGNFSDVCPGGMARAGASAAVAASCHAVLSDATQWALIGWSPFLLWPALHLYLAARSVRQEAEF